MKSTENKWYNLNIDEVAKQLNTNITEGLNNSEAQKRQQIYGKNILPEKKKQHTIIKFLKHFNDVLIYILFVAAAITFYLQEYIDTTIILIVAVINAAIGFFQENKAEKALENIKKMLSLKANVLRNNNSEGGQTPPLQNDTTTVGAGSARPTTDTRPTTDINYKGGTKMEIDAADLTIGDIVFLSPGDKVPADLRLIKADNLRIEESALTGESVPSEKKTNPLPEDTGLGDRINMAFSSTTVRAGTGVGIVVGIGTDTEIGKINQMMSEVETLTTPLLKQTAKFGKMISVVIVGGAGLIFAFGYFFRDYEYYELLLSVIGLAIAVIPEGLPAILSIILAIGVQNMAKRKSIVRTLPSVETLGSVSVICSDKTGTLTKNEMTVKTLETRDGEYFVTGAGYSPVGDIYYNCNNEDCRGDSTVRECCDKVDYPKEPVLQELIQAFNICNEATLYQDEDGQWIINGDPTEGALIALCHKATTNYAKDCAESGDRHSASPTRHSELVSESYENNTETLKQVQGDGEITRDVQVATRNIQVATRNIQVATGNVQVATGNVQVATGNVQVATRDVQVATGNVQVATGDVQVATRDNRANTMNILEEPERLSTIPFDSEYKYMATLIERADHNVIVIKGAPDVLMALSEFERTAAKHPPTPLERGELDPSMNQFPPSKGGKGGAPTDNGLSIEPFVKEHWERQITAIASRGQRTLAAAYKKVDKSVTKITHEHINKGVCSLVDDDGATTVEGRMQYAPTNADDARRGVLHTPNNGGETPNTGIIFLGLAGIIDPPREEAIESVAKCKEAGITVKMITGDHADTAKTIAKELGIGNGTKALQGKELEAMSDEEMENVVLEYDVFARTSPEHKLRLVRALQNKGITCAMTGDGVNDAPSLKKADVGIAMGIKGTEVTKDAAEIVLADDNFSTIVAAVEEGRRVYDNLKKTILFILPTNGAEGFLIMASILFGTILPLTPVQILWVNMITSITISLALAFENIEPGTMKRPPRSPKTPLLSGYFIWRIIFLSVYIGGLTLLLNLYLLDRGFAEEFVRTVTLQTIVLGQMFHLFNARSVREHALALKFFSNKAIFIVCGLLFILQTAVTYLPFMNSAFGTVPLPFDAWIYPFIIGFSVFVVVEIEKAIMRKIDKVRGTPAVY